MPTPINGAELRPGYSQIDENDSTEKPLPELPPDGSSPQLSAELRDYADHYGEWANPGWGASSSSTELPKDTAASPGDHPPPSASSTRLSRNGAIRSHSRPSARGLTEHPILSPTLTPVQVQRTIDNVMRLHATRQWDAAKIAPFVNLSTEQVQEIINTNESRRGRTQDSTDVRPRASQRPASAGSARLSRSGAIRRSALGELQALTARILRRANEGISAEGIAKALGLDLFMVEETIKANKSSAGPIPSRAPNPTQAQNSTDTRKPANQSRAPAARRPLSRSGGLRRPPIGRLKAVTEQVLLRSEDGVNVEAIAEELNLDVSMGKETVEANRNSAGPVHFSTLTPAQVQRTIDNILRLHATRQWDAAKIAAFVNLLTDQVQEILDPNRSGQGRDGS